MLNETIVSSGIGPNSEFGNLSLGIVNGKIVLSATISDAALLASLAKRIGGPLPAEVESFLVGALGLA